jgi:hypothetical protein
MAGADLGGMVCADLGSAVCSFETYELIRRQTVIHAAVLLINLAIVFYMLYLRLTANAKPPGTGGRRGRLPSTRFESER